MFDLSDLNLPTPKAQLSHNWLCVGCRKVSSALKVCSCGEKEFVPYLDRRPLLLNKEARNGIVDLIDAAASRVALVDIDEQLYLTGEYMPFLSRLLDSAELAEKRQLENGGFRTTDLSVSELLSYFSDMKLPPT